MKLKEETVNSKLIYDGKVVKLFLDKVKLPDESLANREIIKHSGGAAILLVDDNRVLLVKQFRYAYNEEIYEIPAGKLEDLENPEIAAVRELEEETGFVATKVDLLAKIFPTPGYTNEVIYIYHAKEYLKKQQKLDSGEFLKVEFIEIEKVLQMIDKGEICDAKTVTAVYKYLLKDNK
ncbi:MAG: NUDIX hydrolase [Clostridiales bacterium]|nr:NUDIX hydrolase [Clostridiales bacterium]